MHHLMFMRINTKTGSKDDMACYSFDKPTPAPMEVPLLVSWDSPTETLKIQTNGSIATGTKIRLTFSKADFPLT
jgi:hypothetical protein